jgi:cyclopropane-fatty-acyl-phospholipid synthase
MGATSTLHGHPRRRERRAVQRSASRDLVAKILASSDVQLDGTRPWDIRVHDHRFFDRVLSHGSVGLGESYMDGWWHAEALDEFFDKVQRIELYKQVGRLNAFWLALKGQIINRQTARRSQDVGREHYDLGNDLYEAMLGETMQYTCGYWRSASTLHEAQMQKLDLIARKLHLSPNMDVLELGSGFGGLAKFLTSEYRCRVVSYNISAEQVAYARDLCHGLPVRFEQRDYREAAKEPEDFDRVVSIGLCEHIGYKNYRSFLNLVHARLKDGGLFLLHTIGGNASYTSTDAWIDKYIFPNGMVPSIVQLGNAMEYHWVVEDWHNFGPDYDRTLMAWWNNFNRAWPDLQKKYGERFYRMWKYYLMASAGTFRSRKLQLWQIVMSKGDALSYTPVR